MENRANRSCQLGGDGLDSPGATPVIDALQPERDTWLHVEVATAVEPDASGTSRMPAARAGCSTGHGIHPGDHGGARMIAKKLPETAVYSAAFSADNRFIAVGMSDGAIALWSRDGRSLPATARHDDRVELLAVSSDGRWLASAGDDSTAG